jgi:hypothetical protein
MPDQPGWRWVYSRIHEEEGPSVFVREFLDQVYVEGSLIGRPFGPLSGCLPPPSSSGQGADQGGAKAPQHRAPLRGELGAILLFDPPLAPMPARLALDETVVTSAQFACYSEWGRHAYDGAVRRSVTLQGLEDLRIGQTDWPKCLRLHVNTIWHFYWGPLVEITQYLWLAGGVGEVRRIERVRGLFLFVAFGATERFDLRSYEAPPDAATSSSPTHRAFRRWTGLAIEMTETMPEPREGGMRIELAPPEERVVGYYPRSAAPEAYVAERGPSRSALD